MSSVECQNSEREMMLYQPRSIKLLFLGMMLFLAACTRINSESDVVGEYQLKVGTGQILLDISSDHKYSETIVLPDGKKQNISGKWLWNNHAVSFDSLW